MIEREDEVGGEIDERSGDRRRDGTTGTNQVEPSPIRTKNKQTKKRSQSKGTVVQRTTHRRQTHAQRDTQTNSATEYAKPPQTSTRSLTKTKFECDWAKTLFRLYFVASEIHRTKHHHYTRCYVRNVC
jgi:hypothetical protein